MHVHATFLLNAYSCNFLNVLKSFFCSEAQQAVRDCVSVASGSLLLLQRAPRNLGQSCLATSETSAQSLPGQAYFACVSGQLQIDSRTTWLRFSPPWTPQTSLAPPSSTVGQFAIVTRPYTVCCSYSDTFGDWQKCHCKRGDLYVNFHTVDDGGAREVRCVHGGLKRSHAVRQSIWSWTETHAKYA